MQELANQTKLFIESIKGFSTRREILYVPITRIFPSSRLFSLQASSFLFFFRRSRTPCNDGEATQWIPLCKLIKSCQYTTRMHWLKKGCNYTSFGYVVRPAGTVYPDSTQCQQWRHLQADHHHGRRCHPSIVFFAPWRRFNGERKNEATTPTLHQLALSKPGGSRTMGFEEANITQKRESSTRLVNNDLHSSPHS